jgi:hypothetical protein
LTSIRIASAASNGPIVKKSPIGRIATSGLYSRPIEAMSPNTLVSPATYTQPSSSVTM